MNAVHPLTYHMVKAEEAHRLARIERRALARQDHDADNEAGHSSRQPVTAPVQRRGLLPKAAGVAIATVALVLSLVAGAALASGGGGGGGGATRVSLQ